MSLLAREGFTSLTLEEFREAARGERELAPRSILITFDDGFADNHLLAWPIAREFGIKLNLFLCTGLVAGETDQDQLTFVDRENKSAHPHLWQPLTWIQVREMSAAGVCAGFHSHTHRNMARLRREELAADAAKGILLFTRELGVRPTCFAFPYGHYGSYSDAAISVLREQGIEMFFTTEMGRGCANSTKPVPRIVIHPEDDLQSFRRKLYGGYDWVGSVRRFGYSVAASLRTGSAMPRE
jgi:peptidoglycan/xylan/chitin deacetylase (PgdA/CDA1 family)